MDSIEITELESVTELSESDTLLMISNDEPKKVTISKLTDIFATEDYVANAITEYTGNT